jgi:hypothetical protein
MSNASPDTESSNADPEELPLQSSVNRLRASTVALARRLDALLGHLEDEQGYADLHIAVKRGIPGMLRIERSYKL